MLTIRFSSQSYAKEKFSPPASSIVVSPDAVTCGDQVFARYSTSLWHIGEKLFTLGTIEGPVMVSFRGPGELSTGPYPTVRFVGQHLFHDGQLLAWAVQDKWVCSRNRGTYAAIVVTADPISRASVVCMDHVPPKLSRL
jgi:hypothetical protein